MKKNVFGIAGLLFVFIKILCEFIFNINIIDYLFFCFALFFIVLFIVSYFKKNDFSNGIKYFFKQLLISIVAAISICIGALLLVYLFYKLGWLGDLEGLL